MKKKWIAALCAGLLLTAATASAEPMLTDGDHAAWIGENNHFFLRAGDNTKVLSSAMHDLLGMDAENYYCLTQTGSIYAIGINADSTPTVVSVVATPEQIAQYRQQPLYTLENGSLKVPQADGTAREISTKALAACTDSKTLYYVEQPDGGQPTLKAAQLDPTAPAVLMTKTVKAPMAMTVSDNCVTLLAEDRSIQVVDLSNWQVMDIAAKSPNTAYAFCMLGDLFTLTVDADGHYTLESQTSVLARNVLPTVSPTTAPGLSYVSPSTATNPPTTVATATQKPTVTAKPTVKPTQKPTATKKPSSSTSDDRKDDGTLYKGDQGSAVRKMQQRLADLGYPVGKVDGVFGTNTLTAVHLFQSAIGKSERSYMSVSNLNKLYDDTAPTYDLYLPLKKGDKGTYVTRLQTRLKELGYDPGKIDGVYGTKTVAAAAEFQVTAGLADPDPKKQGLEMTREMLILLFDPVNAPVKGQPTVAPTAPPVPTPAPTDAPVPTPAPADPATKTDLVELITPAAK